MTNTRRTFSPSRLRELRTAKRWSRTMLAAHVGVAEQTVRLWETGTYKPGVDSYALLCELLATDEEGTTDYSALLESVPADDPPVD